MSEFMTDEDYLWLEEGRRNDWELPPKARPFWRLPVIRNIRYIYHGYRVHARHEFQYDLGSLPTGYDTWCLQAVYRGWI